MDETDTLVRTNDGDDDDEAPTVEETYEVTTTRRKTVRTSYKIQEVSCPGSVRVRVYTTLVSPP